MPQCGEQGYYSGLDDGYAIERRVRVGVVGDTDAVGDGEVVCGFRRPAVLDGKVEEGLVWIRGHGDYEL